MNCYFLRHGIAVEPEEWRGDDFDRPLTREGRQRMKREADVIVDLSLDLDVIVTSPLLRAKQTAEIVADRLGLRGDLLEDERLAGGFGVERLAAILAVHEKAKAIMLVGHEPSMSATVGRLLGDATIEMKKGAVAGVSLAGASSTNGKLICLIPPKVLVRQAKDRNRS